MNPWPMVLADLRAMRWSAPVAIFLIALAVAIGVTVSAQERALRRASARAAADFPLLIGAPGSQAQLVLTAVYLQSEALPLVDGTILNRLASDPRVEASAPLAYGDIVMGYPVIGTTRDFVGRWGRLQPSEGRLFNEENEAVVGADVRLILGEAFKPSHAITGQHNVPGIVADDEVSHRHAQTLLKVVGRLPRTGSAWDRAILIPVESVWETHGLGNGHQTEGASLGPPFDSAKIPGVPAIVVKPKGVAQAYQLRSEYRTSGVMALFPAEALTAMYQLVGDIRDVLVIASVLNNVIIFLAISLLLTTLISLRRRRYAVLRALGATKFYVATVAGLGAAIITSLGALGGFVLGWGATIVVVNIIEARTGLVIASSLEANEFLLALSMAGVGSILAVIGAVAASRKPVADALRS